jgi:mono/diheme cytochrome c family protein
MNKSLATFGGSTLIYSGLAILLGVLPGIWLSQVPPTPGLEPLSSLEARGRDVYVAEGCFYCHTQQVRPLSEDKPFGRPSAPGDYAYQTPELLGSERNGPDLSNIGKRQSSSVWQYIHLYEPRAVVPQSIMPAFPWLFRVVEQEPPGEKAVPLPPSFAPKGVVIPSDEGKALVAYLLSLKQPVLAQPHAGTPPSGRSGGTPGFDAARGASLFADNCAPCHGAEAKGVPGIFPPLAGDPVVNATDPAEQITTVLGGLHGKTINGQKYEGEMTPFADKLSDQQIADIIDHERTSWGNHGPLVTPADVAKLLAKK